MHISLILSSCAENSITFSGSFFPRRNVDCRGNSPDFFVIRLIGENIT